MINDTVIAQDIMKMHPGLTGDQVEVAVKVAKEWYTLAEQILREPCLLNLPGLQCGIEVALHPDKQSEVLARLGRLREQYLNA